MDDLQRRLDRLESRAAIADLTARYCHGADGHDLDVFRSVWHPEALWDVGTAQFRGLGEIEGAVERQWAAFESMFHSTSNGIVEVVADSEATGRQDVLTLTMLAEGRALLSTGRYVDRYVREGDRWLISERFASVITTVELARAAPTRAADQ